MDTCFDNSGKTDAVLTSVLEDPISSRGVVCWHEESVTL